MVPRRRDADDLDPCASIGAMRKADGGLARGRQDHDSPRTEPVVVGEVVFRQPAGDEQPAQQGLTILGVRARLVERVAVRGHVRAIHRRVCRAVLAAVPHAIGGWRHGHVDVTRHGEPAVIASADGDLWMPRLDDLGPAHGGHAAPFRFACGEEVPVAKHVTGGCVGHRIRGHRKALDAKAYLSCCEVGHGGLANPRLGVSKAMNLQRDVVCRHVVSVLDESTVTIANRVDGRRSVPESGRFRTEIDPVRPVVSKTSGHSRAALPD